MKLVASDDHIGRHKVNYKQCELGSLTPGGEFNLIDRGQGRASWALLQTVT